MSDACDHLQGKYAPGYQKGYQDGYKQSFQRGEVGRGFQNYQQASKESNMSMSHNGLTKLIEECGEVIQVAAKLQQFPDGNHPDGKGNLFKRLEQEIADANAAMLFVVQDTMKLSMNGIHDRCVAKRKLYNEWNANSEAQVNNPSPKAGPIL